MLPVVLFIVIPFLFFLGWFASKTWSWFLVCVAIVIVELLWLASQNDRGDMGFTEVIMILHASPALAGGLIQFIRLILAREKKSGEAEIRVDEV